MATYEATRGSGSFQPITDPTVLRTAVFPSDEARQTFEQYFTSRQPAMQPDAVYTTITDVAGKIVLNIAAGRKPDDATIQSTLRSALGIAEDDTTPATLRVLDQARGMVDRAAQDISRVYKEGHRISIDERIYSADPDQAKAAEASKGWFGRAFRSYGLGYVLGGALAPLALLGFGLLLGGLIALALAGPAALVGIAAVGSTLVAHAGVIAATSIVSGVVGAAGGMGGLRGGKILESAKSWRILLPWNWLGAASIGLGAIFGGKSAWKSLKGEIVPPNSHTSTPIPEPAQLPKPIGGAIPSMVSPKKVAAAATVAQGRPAATAGTSQDAAGPMRFEIPTPNGLIIVTGPAGVMREWMQSREAATQPLRSGDIEPRGFSEREVASMQAVADRVLAPILPILRALEASGRAQS